jgi:MFS family permease
MYYNKISFGLSRELWIVQLGVFLNMLGYGAVFPYEVIYLHEARGFSLALAGLVVGVLTGGAVATAPLAGTFIDRFGARAAALVAGTSLAAGYAVLGLARTPAAAFAGAVLAAAGNGGLNPAQSTLVALLAPNEIRHRVSAVSRVVVNFSLGLGGSIGGFVASRGLHGFQVLFFANAVTYLLYVLVLAAVVRRGEHVPVRTRFGYRVVLRDRAFVHLALTNVAMIAVGWGVFSWVVPVYAKTDLGFDTKRLGFVMLANAGTVVLAQVPIARLIEGRRRATSLVAGCLAWIAAYALVVTVHWYPALLTAAALVAVGECFHAVALVPLVAQLAPAELRGRYMATIALAWWIGLAVGSTGALQILARSAPAAFITACAVAGAAAASALAVERRLPEEALLTPARA